MGEGRGAGGGGGTFVISQAISWRNLIGSYIAGNIFPRHLFFETSREAATILSYLSTRICTPLCWKREREWIYRATSSSLSLSLPLFIPFFFFLRPDSSFSPDGTIIDKDSSSRVSK